MKNVLLIFCFFYFGIAFCQNPQINGDVMLCQWTDGTATVTNQSYDTYQWYSKFWFTSDDFQPISGANQQSFTYDWFTYDQSLLKVVVTLGDQTFESNTLLIDSYAFASITVSSELNANVIPEPDSPNLLLCEGGSFTITLNSPYDASIQWYKDGTPIEGANQIQYQVDGPGTYYVVAAAGICPNNTDSTEFNPVVVLNNTNCTLGNTNVAEPDLSADVYPNPVRDILNLDLADVSLYQEYCIIDSTGKVLFQNKLSQEQSTVQTNVASLSNGFYILKLNGNGISASKKFIKE
jgi:hypothetical protein